MFKGSPFRTRSGAVVEWQSIIAHPEALPAPVDPQFVQVWMSTHDYMVSNPCVLDDSNPPKVQGSNRGRPPNRFPNARRIPPGEWQPILRLTKVEKMAGQSSHSQKVTNFLTVVSTK